MALGPIGNTIFVNQQSVAASNVQNAHNNRVEFQNMIAQASANEKEQQVLEIRPTEDNQGVDPDREHNKDDREKKTSKHEEKGKEEDEETSEYEIHTLDIKV
jgi:hypothetical protein